jgi:NAD(P)-dependent dehydrogenase (short-subunit alcohol dehydrogenase family)
MLEGMERFLAGKQAVVTGGTRGIGRAIAEALLREGAQVAICGRSEASVAQAVEELARASGGRVAGQAADVGRPEQVEAFFRFVDEAQGGLDILVNNAGIGLFRPLAEMSVEDWQRTIDTNLSGAFYCAREAVPRLRKRGGGFVINISSLAGKNAIAGGAAYNASKFGLTGLSEAMMLDHRYEDVRVCYIMPGSVDTEFAGRAQPSDWRIAPEDIAQVVLTVLRMPPRTLISRVEIRPTKPRR